MKEKIKKKNCEKLFKRWKKLRRRIFHTDYSLAVKISPPPDEEHKEFFAIGEKLKNECLNCLTTKEKLELGVRIR